MDGDYMVTELLNKTFTNRVLLDTSALISMCDDKADIFDIESELGLVKYFVTESVIRELERLSKESIKKAKCYNMLKKLISSFEIIKDNNDYADKSFLELAEEDYIFVTNDSALAKELKKKGKRVFRMNNKKRFVEL